MKNRWVGLLAVIFLGLAAQMAPADDGAGNVGRTTTTGGGGKVSATQSETFEVVINPGDLISTTRNSLVSLINSSPEYNANVFVDPADPNSNSFQIFNQEGGGVGHLLLCETDPNVDNLGVSFSQGRVWATLNPATKVDANGNFVLNIDLVTASDFSMTFSTSTPPSNSPSGLNGSISAALVTAGYAVSLSNSGSIVITKPGDRIRAIRISASDTGIVTSCLELSDIQPAMSQIPTLSQVGLFLLVLLMTGAALLVLRRKGAASA